jgi:hypothetical protein
MAFLKQLPLASSAEILCFWINVKELTKFDSSFSDLSKRRDLLELLKSPCFVINECKLSNVLHYVCTRDLKVSLFTIKSAHFAILNTNKLNSTLITQITINGARTRPFAGTQHETEWVIDSQLINFINQCPLLTSLTLTGVVLLEINEISEISPIILSQLTALNLTRNSQITLSLFSYFAIYCTNLTTLHLNIIDQNKDICGTDVINLILNNQFLTDLTLNYNNNWTFNTQLFNDININCSDLVKFELCCCDMSFMSKIPKFIENAKSLINFSLTYGNLQNKYFRIIKLRKHNKNVIQFIRYESDNVRIDRFGTIDQKF